MDRESYYSKLNKVIDAALASQVLLQKIRREVLYLSKQLPEGQDDLSLPQEYTDRLAELEAARRDNSRAIARLNAALAEDWMQPEQCEVR